MSEYKSEMDNEFDLQRPKAKENADNHALTSTHLHFDNEWYWCHAEDDIRNYSNGAGDKKVIDDIDTTAIHDSPVPCGTDRRTLKYDHEKRAEPDSNNYGSCHLQKLSKSWIGENSKT